MKPSSETGILGAAHDAESSESDPEEVVALEEDEDERGSLRRNLRDDVEGQRERRLTGVLGGVVAGCLPFERGGASKT